MIKAESILTIGCLFLFLLTTCSVSAQEYFAPPTKNGAGVFGVKIEDELEGKRVFADGLIHLRLLIKDGVDVKDEVITKKPTSISFDLQNKFNSATPFVFLDNDNSRKVLREGILEAANSDRKNTLFSDVVVDQIDFVFSTELFAIPRPVAIRLANGDVYSISLSIALTEPSSESFQNTLRALLPLVESYLVEKLGSLNQQDAAAFQDEIPTFTVFDGFTNKKIIAVQAVQDKVTLDLRNRLQNLGSFTDKDLSIIRVIITDIY